MDNFQVSPDGQWIIAVEDQNEVVIFSAADGRESGRLSHPQSSEGLYVWISPHSRRILTRRNPVEASDSKPLKGIFRLWEADPWHECRTHFSIS